MWSSAHNADARLNDPRVVKGLFSSEMLARISGTDPSAVRRWARRGWIQPVCEQKGVAYFDAKAAAVVRRLAALAASGVSLRRLGRHIDALRHRFPEVEHPLIDPRCRVVGETLIYDGPQGPCNAQGQRLLAFLMPTTADEQAAPDLPSASSPATVSPGIEADTSRGHSPRAEQPPFSSIAQSPERKRTGPLRAGRTPPTARPPERLLFPTTDIETSSAKRADPSTNRHDEQTTADARRESEDKRPTKTAFASDDAIEAADSATDAAENAPWSVPGGRIADLLAGESVALPTHPAHLVHLAWELEEDGRWEEAAEMYRAAMAAGGPTAELCFQTAEMLYRMNDLTGARERYYMALELDESYVPARISLGCVLIELGQDDLAEAAFRGALRYHPHYADAHYFLARLLDRRGEPQEAEHHWRAFLEWAPDSPWADEARQRLGC